MDLWSIGQCLHMGCRNESRRVRALGQDQMEVVIETLPVVEIMQAFAEPMSFHANDRILCRIEVGSPSQGLDSNIVLRDGMNPREVLFAYVPQQAAGVVRTGKKVRGQHRIVFRSFARNLI